MVLVVKKAAQEDASVVAEFVYALLKELTGSEDIDREGMSATAEALLRRGTITAFVAYRDTTPVGVISLHECAAIYAGGVFGEISELYVTPAYRSQGVAADLLSAAQAEGVARGWKRLEVGAPTQPQWHRTLAFYEGQGFLETGPRLRRLI
ncbi:GNAT family N-acetyltransferase [uncultured Shimia sp.]|uniref:GNAT family N-acetyltransferase n=1 Tax=uncultured Shimia sp. TaxID=573152 RepID=UPI002622550E|nr:GNAT family N-acetyltransferase [uncultured Shimia sp.]